MKRIKVPDYKDRNVFGVPLTVNVQRTGQPLPQSIQQAMRYLRNHCLDQVRSPLPTPQGQVWRLKVGAIVAALDSFCMKMLQPT